MDHSILTMCPAELSDHTHDQPYLCTRDYDVVLSYLNHPYQGSLSLAVANLVARG